MFIGFGIIILIMLAVIGNTYINFVKESEAVKWNVHTYKVIQESDCLLMSLLDMETGARGYVITGNESFLEPFNKGNSSYENHYDKLKQLTEDNSEQQQRLYNINNKYKEWVEWEKNIIIAKRKEVSSGKLKLEDLIAIVQSGYGKNMMDELRSILGDINNEEERLLQNRNADLIKMEKETRVIMLTGGALATIAAIIIASLSIRMIVNPVKVVTNTFREIAEGEVNLEARLMSNSEDEIGKMARYFNIFMTKLKELISENRNQSWLTTGRAELNEEMRGVREINTLSSRIITYICRYLNMQIGIFYVKTDSNTFKVFGSYSYNSSEGSPDEFNIGEGLVGQAALEDKIVLVQDVPADYMKIISGLGEAVPKNILIAPCMYHEEIECIIELGSFNQFTDVQLKFIEQVSENIATSINLTKAQTKMEVLLNKTLVQAEELQVQQEELRQNNEELEEQAKILKQSEMNLQTQQEELRVSNEELEEQTKKLEQQKRDISENNKLLRKANHEIEGKAKELEIANKYKSEFLANMSHELRTPLNSIIVLSQLLENKKANEPLTEKQLEYSKTIHSSGKNLLRLIDDILDLSKVESGKIDINFDQVNLAELAENTKSLFTPIILQKNIDFNIEIEDGLPEKIISDEQRLQQIINNLLSNAFKFTETGYVKMNICRPKEEDIKNYKIEENVNKLISIEIIDTGIGIPADKQTLIFEAFKQVDGTISRKYGGTGLGLSISRELARLLGGNIYLKSEEGKGSKFTLVFLDNDNMEQVKLNKEEYSGIDKNYRDNLEEKIISENDINEFTKDEHDESKKEDEKLLLIIEDDEQFSTLLSELAYKKNYKVLIEKNSDEAIKLAEKYNPYAILLDSGLSDNSGLRVVDKLQNLEYTKNIPIHIISWKEDKNSYDKMKNLVWHIKKPYNLEELYNLFDKIETSLSNDSKKLLIVDEDKSQSNMIYNNLNERGFKITTLESGLDAYKLLKDEQFDCMILDLNLKDMNGIDLVNKLKEENLVNFPILIYTEGNITQEEEDKLNKYTESIIIKGNNSIDRLLDEVSLFFHSVDSNIDNKNFKNIKFSEEKENLLNNKNILIVDDDMRNVFSLTSALEEKGMNVVVGRNGSEGIKKLYEKNNIDLILMDVMMPEMDGYTAMKEIRKEKQFDNIPIIAITAKSMKEDRQKCIEAGSNDYLTKPVDINKLISLLKVWLYK
ncbi:Signal transduction histidine-protein kinase BarA [Clostridium neonatale]|uniref:Circadian input-output histidine kinase CikA n=3 Tax=Clostridium neonatale TaxID=137838 RepID=A0A650MI20_9CLOT|nr:putative two-component sensor signal histidine kinase [Clostridium neonatale]CAI3553016.1 putative two-component sensor signal histidine kinase [Clostridium neonatale]CAI3590814.1 putative two-component sensor signal histidine kinase [Clostridium neonatale]CAI3631441.1 putative two-component sensor signal histidine kinase [Clostridium neonatale]CAI3647958.1 putative two-component sensor signal histidine kinase [Clostridium neonatale]